MRNKIYIILILLSYVSTASVSLEGSLDLRPTWSPASPSLHYENELGVKLKWNEVSSFGYVQEFVGNLIGKSELNSFDLREGSIRGESKINSTLHFEARLLLPTDQVERENTFKGGIRPILTFSVIEKNYFGLELSESPIARFYQVSTLDNRLDLTPKITLFSESLFIRLPVIWLWKQFANSEIRWNPEAILKLSPNLAIGVVYCTESMLDFKKGTAQLVLQYTLN